MYNICKIKNLTGEITILNGHEFAVDELYTISDENRLSWQGSDSVISAISSGDFQIYDSLSAITSISDQIDWLKNYEIHPTDSDGAELTRVKLTKSGWGLQCHAISFTTSLLNSVYNKDKDGSDLGFTSLKFYNSSDTELTTQNDIDSGCVKTVMTWEPTYDYEIIGGEMWQDTDPTTDIYGWLYHSYTEHEFCSGGFNLKLIGSNNRKKMDGRTPKYMQYTSGYHTNEMVIVIRHDAGVQHSLQFVLEIFKEI